MRNSTEVDFRFLSDPIIIKAGATDMARCIDVMEDQFKLLSLGDYRMSGKNKNSHGAFMDFPRELAVSRTCPVAGPDRRFMAMCSYLASYNMCGLKMVRLQCRQSREGPAAFDFTPRSMIPIRVRRWP